MNIKIYLIALLVLIIQPCYSQIVPIETDGATVQSENSVFIARTNPTGDPSTFYIIDANNTNNWVSGALGNLCLKFTSPNYWSTNYGSTDLLASYDGGSSWLWSSSVLYGVNGSASDPSVCIDLNNYWYYAYLIPSGGHFNVEVAHSYDYGNSWASPVVVGSSGYEDKPDVWVDNKRHLANGSSNPNEGTVYAAWTDFTVSPSQIMLSASFDQGQSWSSPGSISSALDVYSNTGVNIKTGPTEEWYACWAIYPGGSPLSENQIGFASSYYYPTGIIIQNIGGIRYESFKGSETMRKNSFPVMAVNQLNGNVYVVWADNNSGNGFRIKMITCTSLPPNPPSFPNSPIQVGNGSSFTDQWFPWITCDETSGTIAVIYYATPATSPNDVNTWVSYSYDEGQTWTDQQITGNSWDGDAMLNNGVFAVDYAGDYIGIDMFAGYIVPGWSDNESGSNTKGFCPGNSNMLAYSSPFSVLCNSSAWSFCSSLNPNPYNVSDYAFFQSQQSITAGGSSCPPFTVQPSGYCTMQVTASSGNAIRLEPGFSAKSGSYFHASISGCTDPPHAPVHHDNNNQYSASSGNSGINISDNIAPNESTSKNLTLYPNPTTGSFTLQLNQTSTNGNITGNVNHVYIYSVYGQTIYQTTTTQNTLTLNLSGQPAGLYLVKVQSGNNTFSKKLVLN